MGGIGGEEIFSLVRRRDRIISAPAGNRITIRNPSINAANYAMNHKQKKPLLFSSILFTLFHDPRRTSIRSRIYCGNKESKSNLDEDEISFSKYVLPIEIYDRI